MPGEYRIVGHVHDELIVDDPWPEWDINKAYGEPAQSKELTYRFVKGKGWVAGYWADVSWFLDTPITQYTNNGITLLERVIRQRLEELTAAGWLVER